MRSQSSPSRHRILLIGQGTSALTALEALAERFEVVGVVRAANPADTVADPVYRRAQELGVLVYGDVTIEAINTVVMETRPDCVVVSSISRILPAALVAKTRFVNVHYAPLPRCRGMTTANWALINGDTDAGITIHTIVPGMDEGNVLCQRLVRIRNDDNVVTLQERLHAAQREVLADAVQRHLEGYAGEPQDEREATYVCTRVPSDGEIDWTCSARKIGRLVRALVDPFPGAFTYFQGQRLVVWRAEPVPHPRRFEGRIPGRVVAFSRQEGTVDVLAGKGILRIHEVQREGQSHVAAAELINSTRATLGLRIADLLQRVEMLEKLLATHPTIAPRTR